MRPGFRAFVFVVAAACCAASCYTSQEDSQRVGSIRSALAGEWSATGSLPGSRIYHSATVLPSGQVLLAGGWGPGAGFQNAAFLYEPASGTWSSTGSLSTARQAHAATRLADGRALVVGGETPSGYTASAEVYEPATGTWSPAGSISRARGYNAAVRLLDGKVLLTGGLAGGALKDVDVYEPASHSWTAAAPMLEPRFNHTATLLADGRVLVVGGSVGIPVASAEVYDPASNTWTATANTLGTPRFGHVAARLADGKVLIAGGWSPSPTATAEVYDPATNAFTSTASMTAARGEPAATPLPDGTVLVTGGKNASSALASAELYDAATGAWKPTSDMAGPRERHVAVQLAAVGKVLVVGGFNTSLLNTAETYEYSTPCLQHTDCPAGNYCSASVCVPALPEGNACSDVRECASGHCVDGVCCDSACSGACDACNLAGSLGTCSFLDSTTLCRPSARVCDTSEYCTGSSADCPADGYAPDGMGCLITEGEWGPCGDFSDFCAETGTQSRTSLGYTCEAGTCSAYSGSTTYTRSCMRPPPDTSCASPTYGAWSACSYSSTCAETGTQSRTVTTYSFDCATGQCVASTTTETQGCTRDTDGTTCGSTSYGNWGDCTYSSTCDEAGGRSRSVTSYTCSNGSCSASSGTETTRSDCYRDTDGDGRAPSPPTNALAALVTPIPTPRPRRATGTPMGLPAAREARAAVAPVCRPRAPGSSRIFLPYLQLVRDHLASGEDLHAARLRVRHFQQGVCVYIHL